MPSPPELPDRSRDVGIVEVLEYPESEQAHQAERHVGIAGEVEIDLERITDQAQPGERRGQLARWQVKDQIGDAAQRVCDEYFLAEAQQKPAQPIRDIGHAPVAARDLLAEVAPPDDRSGDELRKEQDVEGKVEQPALGPGVPLVHVDHVRDRVEREEGDAQRQRDVVPLDPIASDGQRDLVQVRHREVRVLEDRERQQVERDSGREPATPRQRQVSVADREPESPVGEDRGHDEADEPAFAPHVEQHACDEQDRIPRGPGRDGVRSEDHRQEE